MNLAGPVDMIGRQNMAWADKVHRAGVRNIHGAGNLLEDIHILHSVVVVHRRAILDSLLRLHAILVAPTPAHHPSVIVSPFPSRSRPLPACLGLARRRAGQRVCWGLAGEGGQGFDGRGRGGWARRGVGWMGCKGFAVGGEAHRFPERLVQALLWLRPAFWPKQIFRRRRSLA